MIARHFSRRVRASPRQPVQWLVCVRPFWGVTGDTNPLQGDLVSPPSPHPVTEMGDSNSHLLSPSRVKPDPRLVGGDFSSLYQTVNSAMHALVIRLGDPLFVRRIARGDKNSRVI